MIMNIKFNYLYRDGANYKQYNHIVFLNPDSMPTESIKTIIENNLIEGAWFVAKNWQLPDLHFQDYDWDDSIDHEWHEVAGIEETNEVATTSVSINDFLIEINSSPLQ